MLKNLMVTIASWEGVSTQIILYLGGETSNILYVYPNLGEDEPNLTLFFRWLGEKPPTRYPIFMLPWKLHEVRNHLWVFINCLIENPAFDSQTKESLGHNIFCQESKVTPPPTMPRLPPRNILPETNIFAPENG